jgi:hypothetical protein
VTVFDEFVPTGTIDTNPVYTSIVHNRVLASGNGINLYARVDEINGPAGDFNFMVFVEHSGDGKNWLSYGAPNLNVALVGGASVVGENDMADSTLGVTSTVAETETGPLLGFVRLCMYSDAGGFSGHVRVLAFIRN